MIKIRDRVTREVIRVELTAGEKQYLASTNLKSINPAAHARVKTNGAKRWLKRLKRNPQSIGLPSSVDSTQER